MPFSKSVSHPAAEIVTYTTSLPFATVQTRLEAGIHKASSQSTSWLANFQKATTPDAITAVVRNATQGADFLYFSQYSFSTYLRVLQSDPAIPNTIAYEFGNPLIAATIVSINLDAGLFIPPRMLLREIPGARGNKTSLTYYLPSSLLPRSQQSRSYRTSVLALDAAVEKLVLNALD